jgi:MFS family permease
VSSEQFAREISLTIGGTDKYIWLDQAIVIVTCVLGPPVSQAADLWGRKWFLVITTACGFVGSIIISRATSMGMAIAGQVVLSLAYASQPLLYAVASEILPRRYRPAAQGGLNTSIGVAGIIALIAGSAMVANYHEGFRVFWYFVAAVQAAASITCAICYNPPPRPLQKRLTTGEKLRRLDWVAYVFLALAVVLAVMGLTWAENPYSWKDAHVLAPLLLGVGFLVALIVHQTKFKKDGLFHHDLFRGQRNFAIAMGIMFTDGAAFFAANGYFALEVSVLYETSLIRVGLRFSIVFFAGMVASTLISFYSSYTKNVRFPITVSFTLFVIFFGTHPFRSYNANSS